MKYKEENHISFSSFIKNRDINDLTLNCKFGLGRALSETSYSHHFEAEGKSDANFALVTMVPLSFNLNKNEIWVNEKPNFINFTGPLFFIYDKESPGLVTDILSKVNYSFSQEDIFESFVGGFDQGHLDKEHRFSVFLLRPGHEPTLPLSGDNIWADRSLG